LGRGSSEDDGEREGGEEMNEEILGLLGRIADVLAEIRDAVRDSTPLSRVPKKGDPWTPSGKDPAKQFILYENIPPGGEAYRIYHELTQLKGNLRRGGYEYWLSSFQGKDWLWRKPAEEAVEK